MKIRRIIIVLHCFYIGNNTRNFRAFEGILNCLSLMFVTKVEGVTPVLQSVVLFGLKHQLLVKQI